MWPWALTRLFCVHLIWTAIYLVGLMLWALCVHSSKEANLTDLFIRWAVIVNTAPLATHHFVIVFFLSGLFLKMCNSVQICSFNSFSRAAQSDECWDEGIRREKVSVGRHTARLVAGCRRGFPSRLSWYPLNRVGFKEMVDYEAILSLWSVATNLGVLALTLNHSSAAAPVSAVWDEAFSPAWLSPYRSLCCYLWDAWQMFSHACPRCSCSVVTFGRCLSTDTLCWPPQLASWTMKRPDGNTQEAKSLDSFSKM